MTKKPLIGSVSSAFSTSCATRPPARLTRFRQSLQSFRARAVLVAAADDDIEALVLELREHRAEHRVVVLQVAVHHREIRGRRRQDALDAGARQAAPAEPADDPHAPVAGGDPAGDIGSAVRRIVVDEDDLPGNVPERMRQPLDDHRHVRRLVEGRHDHGQLDCTGLGVVQRPDSPRGAGQKARANLLAEAGARQNGPNPPKARVHRETGVRHVPCGIRRG